MELAEKYGYICHTHKKITNYNDITKDLPERSDLELKKGGNNDFGVCGIVDYFINTPMTTVALVIGPKAFIPKELKADIGILSKHVIEQSTSPTDSPHFAIKNHSNNSFTAMWAQAEKDTCSKVNSGNLSFEGIKQPRPDHKKSSDMSLRGQNLNYTPGRNYRIFNLKNLGNTRC